MKYGQIAEFAQIDTIPTTTFGSVITSYLASRKTVTLMAITEEHAIIIAAEGRMFGDVGAVITFQGDGGLDWRDE